MLRIHGSNPLIAKFYKLHESEQELPKSELRNELVMLIEEITGKYVGDELCETPPITFLTADHKAYTAVLRARNSFQAPSAHIELNDVATGASVKAHIGIDPREIKADDAQAAAEILQCIRDSDEFRNNDLL